MEWSVTITTLPRAQLFFLAAAGHLRAAELALESVVMRHVGASVLGALALRHMEQDMALHQLMVGLAQGRHQVLLRTGSMELQAQVSRNSEPGRP